MCKPVNSPRVTQIMPPPTSLRNPSLVDMRGKRKNQPRPPHQQRKSELRIRQTLQKSWDCLRLGPSQRERQGGQLSTTCTKGDLWTILMGWPPSFRLACRRPVASSDLSQSMGSVRQWETLRGRRRSSTRTVPRSHRFVLKSFQKKIGDEERGCGGRTRREC